MSESDQTGQEEVGLKLIHTFDNTTIHQLNSVLDENKNKWHNGFYLYGFKLYAYT